MMRRKNKTIGMLAIVAILLVGTYVLIRPGVRPNVLVIVLDTARADHFLVSWVTVARPVRIH